MQHKRSTTMSDNSYKSQTHQKRPSIQATMHWLSRSPTPVAGSTVPSPGSYSPSKPVKVQEPKYVRTIDLISNPPRSAGVLGTGATVVRTPDDALKETGVRVHHSDGTGPSEKKDKTPRPKHKRAPSRQALISPATSPPLPPLPLPEEDEERILDGDFVPTTPPRTNRSLPGVSTPEMQRTISKRSSMKIPKSISVSNSASTYDEPPSVPPLPLHIALSTQPPPFSPILVSEHPTPLADQSKVIVTLETCTQSFRTTLSTLCSRPSRLSKYLSSFYRTSASGAISQSSSVYSHESEDMSMYRQHLTTQGLVPVSTSFHFFLDRPSAPYYHILAYLRTPHIEGQPETLPHALRLHSSGSSTSTSNLNVNSQQPYAFPPSSPSSNTIFNPYQTRLETLIEVRDEAAYLQLEALHKLCNDEIRHRYGPRLAPPNNAQHTRGQSTNSVHSLQASVYSLSTLLEKVETDLRHSSNTTTTTTGQELLGSQHLAAVSTPTPISAPTPPPTAALPPVPTSAPASTTGPFAPPPAAIAIRRSKQMLNSHSHSHSYSNSTSTSSLEAQGITKTPPTPRSLETTQENPQKPAKSSSRSSSRSRPVPGQPAPVGWI